LARRLLGGGAGCILALALLLIGLTGGLLRRQPRFLCGLARPFRRSAPRLLGGKPPRLLLGDPLRRFLCAQPFGLGLAHRALGLEAHLARIGLAPRTIAIARELLLERVAHLHRPEQRLRGRPAPPPAGPHQLVRREQPPAVVAL